MPIVIGEGGSAYCQRTRSGSYQQDLANCRGQSQQEIRDQQQPPGGLPAAGQPTAELAYRSHHRRPSRPQQG